MTFKITGILKSHEIEYTAEGIPRGTVLVEIDNSYKYEGVLKENKHLVPFNVYKKIAEEAIQIEENTPIGMNVQIESFRSKLQPVYYPRLRIVSFIT
jgi:hypothetical protein